MSQDWFADVMEFHKEMDLLIGTTPKRPSPKIEGLRFALEEEEFAEMLRAVGNGDVPEMAKEIVDLIYVLIGRAVSYGIDLRPVWDAVQKANMAKVGGPIREDGKRLKPPGWEPPDIKGILERQKSLAIVPCWRCGGKMSGPACPHCDCEYA